jgi:hypothetical protein
MNMIRECPTCGGPVYGGLLYSIHYCRPALAMTLPQPPDPTPIHKRRVLDCDDDITPGQATRLCSRIKMEIAVHFKSCKWCQMLKEQDLACVDGLLMRDTLKKWEQYTLIKVDRHV